MVVKALEFLEDLAADEPELAPQISELATLYQRKLWHQLTVKLEACFALPSVNKGDLPMRLYNSFIQDFAHKINLLKLAQFAVHASKYQPVAPDAISFLNGVIAKLEELRLPRSAEPILFLRMHVAQHKLESGALPDAKTMVEAGKDALGEISDSDPSVSAAVYYVASLYYKAVSDYAEFYKSGLMYLAFVASDTLPAVGMHRVAASVWAL